MYLSRIRVRNFRNFHCLDVKLGPKSVVVGENNVGKTNLLFALRLILDPKLSDTSRQLREEDFWDGLSEPAKSGETIEIAIELSDFRNDENVLAVLQEFCVLGPLPDTALLTYCFRPKASFPQDQELSIRDYEFLVFGGGLEGNKVDHNVRRWIPLEVLPALRDAESDLATWRKSPLKPLVENLRIPDTTLRQVATSIDKATNVLLDESDVQQLIQEIQSRLSLMVGSVHEISPSLGFAPTTPERLTRALRMFGDGARKRPVGELSLGIDNLLYLLLLAIELEQKEAACERAKTILAIEEPESHLHPQLQRLVFRDFLRREPPVFLTTHSPHIASVAPLESIVLLRNDQRGDGSKGRSAFQAGLDNQEIADLERYLDATRSEILFARGVILVEGATELFLIPALARSIDIELDVHGITVCSVHGTNFAPYAKLLGPAGLNIPFVILTDGDWYKTEDGNLKSRGLRRAVLVAKALGHANSALLENMNNSKQWHKMYQAAIDIGIFVGCRTLEADIFEVGYRQEVVDTLSELGASKNKLEQLQNLVGGKPVLNDSEAELLMTAIKDTGKGSVAQRLAGKISDEKPPDYVKRGVCHIVKELS